MFFFVVVIAKLKPLDIYSRLKIFSVIIENLNHVGINIEASITKLDTFWHQFEEHLIFIAFRMNHDIKSMQLILYRFAEVKKSE